ncbi:hypothetical protein F4777DRAFT_531214 [Nemania sp. FL0916]|nr:hypothetical protein F4777DRAFT_531214 [Nemania sp. FL0916]
MALTSRYRGQLLIVLRSCLRKWVWGDGLWANQKIPSIIEFQNSKEGLIALANARCFFAYFGCVFGTDSRQPTVPH